MTQDCSPEDLLQEIDLIVTDLRQMVDKAATEAESFDSVERDVCGGVLQAWGVA
ncbi:MAG: hypothetical protein R3C05_12550 [Pirellulaceae bacterium]